MKNIELEITRNIIAALHGFLSQDGTRPAIMGIHFECREQGVTLIATDGRRMACYFHETRIPLPTGETMIRFTVDPGDALTLFKNPKVTWHVSTNEDGSEVSFAISKDTRIVARNLESSPQKQFPNWKSVIPTTEAQATCEFLFNPELMETFTKAAKLLASKRSLRIVKHAAHEAVDGSNAPYSIFVGNRSFYGLLMPMRGDYSDYAAPSWCRPPVVPVPTVPTGETTQPAPGAHAGSEQEGAHGFETSPATTPAAP